ncbi:hypothetical protein DFH08DRAFT_1042040 [Mycena albidolilacea]|uniref:FAD-binding domain-containing protein n=1 Tax=Mycena albidolilacea TaxID=1033008 RepID=A0AAD6ZAP9_9AGAR|nr:hypothetical protein DFH08DRAFT_1042040 [Mycena albidolilacea]
MSHAPSLKFIIVGASTAGLSAAISLKAAGQNVLVLEKDSELGGPARIPTGGVRQLNPPEWIYLVTDVAQEEEVRATAVIGKGFTSYTYEGSDSGRDYIGAHHWDPELMEDAGGLFLQMRHRDILHILYDAALREPSKNSSTAGSVVVEFNTEVVDADFEAGSVTLKSGVVHSGDVLIGADGASGFIRQRMLKERDETLEDEPSGLAVYSAIIPKNVAVADSELKTLYEPSQKHMVTFYQGSNRGAQAFLAGKDEDVVFWVYTPDGLQDGTWSQPAERHITDILGPCDPLIERLAALAQPATGKVVLIGEAAHPFPIISLHAYAIAIEDGAFIGKIFSHIRDADRITEFLYAFEEKRKPRCSVIDASEKEYINLMALPDGPIRVKHVAGMRANAAAGRNVMDSGDLNDLGQIWDNMRDVFGYNAADDADEWWVSWGRLHDAPNASKAKGEDILQCMQE